MKSLIFYRLTEICYEDITKRAYIDCPNPSGKYAVEFMQGEPRDITADTFDSLLTQLLEKGYMVQFLPSNPHKH